MQRTHALQLLLPTDKRNPSLSLNRDEAQRKIHVYHRFELLEKVQEDRKHPQYKLMVANLYNAGLKVASLEEIFGFDRKTMRAGVGPGAPVGGWGAAQAGIGRAGGASQAHPRHCRFHRVPLRGGLRPASGPLQPPTAGGGARGVQGQALWGNLATVAQVPGFQTQAPARGGGLGLPREPGGGWCARTAADCGDSRESAARCAGGIRLRVGRRNRA